MHHQHSEQLWLPLHVLVIGVVGLFLGFGSLWIAPVWLFIGLGGIIYFLIVWLWPEIALLGVILWSATIFDIYSLPSVSIGVGHLVVSDFLLFIPIGIILIRVMVEPKFKLKSTPLNLPLLAFYGIAILSTMIAISKSTLTFNQSLGEIRVINFYLSFFIVTNLIQDEKRLRRLLNGIFLLAFFVAAAMILQYVVGDAIKILPGRVETLGTAGTVTQGVTRVLPPGQSLVLVVLVTLIVLLVLDKNPSSFLTRFFLTFVIGGAVLLTFNRSFWVAMSMAIFLVVFLISKRDKMRFINLTFGTVLIGALILVPVVALVGEKAQTLIEGSIVRLESLFNPDTVSESSLQDRYIENSYAVPQIIAHPFLGLGFGANYRPRDWRIDYGAWTWNETYYIHNGHYWVMLKAGIIGYLLFMWFLLLFIKRALQGWRRIPDPFLGGIVLSFAAALIGILAASFVNPIFSNTYWSIIIGVMVGIGETILRLKKPDQYSARTLVKLG